MSFFLVGATLLSSALAAVQYAGVNIAGFDFGCLIDGTCPTSSVVAPLADQGGPDGKAQVRSPGLAAESRILADVSLTDVPFCQ